MPKLPDSHGRVHVVKWDMDALEQSAKEFWPAAIGWTLFMLFALLGRYGEGRDATDILGWQFAVPPEWSFWVAAAVSAAIGSFIPFHRVRQQRDQWKMEASPSGAELMADAITEKFVSLPTGDVTLAYMFKTIGTFFIREPDLLAFRVDIESLFLDTNTTHGNAERARAHLQIQTDFIEELELLGLIDKRQNERPLFEPRVFLTPLGKRVMTVLRARGSSVPIMRSASCTPADQP